jgi:hypothetical protein
LRCGPAPRCALSLKSSQMAGALHRRGDLGRRSTRVTAHATRDSRGARTDR